MTTLIVGLVLFLGVHSIAIVAPQFRARAVASLGERVWKGLYALISLIGLVLIIRGFAAARVTSMPLYVPPGWLHRVTLLLMLPVFPLLFAAYLPGRIQARAKHPMLVAVKTWAFAHLLANGLVVDVVLFGSVLLWAGLDRVSIRYRSALRPVPHLPTSRFNDVLAIVLGLIVYALLIGGLHQRLIGVSPLS
jgi:uncharacterized membrane protein